MALKSFAEKINTKTKTNKTISFVTEKKNRIDTAKPKTSGKHKIRKK